MTKQIIKRQVNIKENNNLVNNPFRTFSEVKGNNYLENGVIEIV